MPVFAAMLWLLLTSFLFVFDQFFLTFDMEHGVLRSVAVLALVPAGIALAGLRAAAPRSWGLGGGGALAWVCAAGGCCLVGWRLLDGVGHVQLLDQAYNAFDATNLWLSGQNPYAATTLDPRYLEQMQQLGSVDPSMLGYKYGPLSLYSGWPFFAARGVEGLLLHDALAELGILAAVFLLLRQEAVGVAWALAFAASPFAAETFAHVISQGMSDPAPVLLALLAMVAVRAGSFGAAGGLLAASLCSKPMPGALYGLVLWPLLGQARFVLAAVAVTGVLVGPFLLASPAALARSLLIFPFFSRGPDSTALQFYISASWRQALVAVTFATGVLVASFAARGGTRRALVGLLALHVCALALGNRLHNDYLTWLYPLIAVTFALLWTPPAQPATTEEEPPGARTLGA